MVTIIEFTFMAIFNKLRECIFNIIFFYFKKNKFFKSWCIKKVTIFINLKTCCSILSLNPSRFKSSSLKLVNIETPNNFKLIYDLLMKISLTRNKLQFAAFISILAVFLPILPGGSFFSDYALTLFFINFSLLFCTNKSSNLFYKNL